MKIVLAYSGGLDTSVILKWLINEYNADVYCYNAFIGQHTMSAEEIKQKAISTGAKDCLVENLEEEFVRDFVNPMFRMNALYEGEYLLGTSIARPLISQRMLQYADSVGATHISHGATGKGNDQIRFELSAYAINPNIQVIAPWRIWDIDSRTKLMAFARENNIDIPMGKESEPPFSIDDNLLHTSMEGNDLEDLESEPKNNTYLTVKAPWDAPNEPTELMLEFEKGDLVAIDGVRHSADKLLKILNQKGGENAIGRLDLVENRFVGMKSRGIYETPGGAILLKTHRALEGITLDREVAHLKDDLMPKYSTLIYNGLWFSPERRAIQALIDHSQEMVSGKIGVKLYKGNIIITHRSSPYSLYSSAISSFENDSGMYDQKDADGFIKVNSLRLKCASLR